ncbi:glycoside hydrolase family 3 domain protein [Thermodesulfatator indicus DSM 15286]|uniref:beta-N-acetylhexosaminidase n=1 Tax=Thermodesulfatator indicus (strain DSM 15286 / JCM 11887 / CIR29812) TaxID=667014 RepID=F8A9U5_THEID|nr:glycoside hydrolase family 3 N-terminal domain-containing protein [Thermodesulfatator indicus]AEH44143.1 glycoside hydrolase family 3 domain protein [Thermodesulfatator indicus DSM 15286]
MQKIGKLFIVGLEGDSLSAEELEAIKALKLSHFIFFKRNLVSKEQIESLLTKLNEKTGLGLRAVDQEGGPVVRLLPPLFPQLPSLYALAQREKPAEEVRNTAKLCAQNLKELGFNFNLAPVLDLADDKAPSFIRERSFDKESSLVAELGTIYIKTFIEEGLLCCAKHFPGLGGVDLDPHHSLPEKPEVTKDDLYPFVKAFEAGVPAVMTTHLVVKNIDDKPATFSPKIINMLRRELDFRGLVLTDDLYMKGAAISSFEERVLRAFISGHDLLLLCEDFWQSVIVIENFIKEAEHSYSLKELIAESLGRQNKVLNSFLPS